MHRTIVSRRGMLLSAAGLAALSTGAAEAQNYPTRPVRIVLPLGAGGVGDISARIIAERLGDKLGQRFIIENMPGAGGITAARAVLSAPADGYTLALFTGGIASAVPLFKNLTFDPLTDFVPISSMGYFDCLFVTNSGSEYKDLGDFLKAARAKPGALNIGTISAGGVQHLTANYFKQAAKLDFVIVPFRTTPEAIVALLRNDVQLVIDFYAALKSGLSDQKIRAVAWSGVKRAPSLPDVPTTKEFGVENFESVSWNSLYAAKSTPPEPLAKINAALREVLADSDVKKRLLDLGIESKASSPAEMDAQMRGDIKKWTEVIARAGIERQ